MNLLKKQYSSVISQNYNQEKLLAQKSLIQDVQKPYMDKLGCNITWMLYVIKKNKFKIRIDNFRFGDKVIQSKKLAKTPTNIGGVHQ